MDLLRRSRLRSLQRGQARAVSRAEEQQTPSSQSLDCQSEQWPLTGSHSGHSASENTSLNSTNDLQKSSRRRSLLKIFFPPSKLQLTTNTQAEGLEAAQSGSPTPRLGTPIGEDSAIDTDWLTRPYTDETTLKTPTRHRSHGSTSSTVSSSFSHSVRRHLGKRGLSKSKVHLSRPAIVDEIPPPVPFIDSPKLLQLSSDGLWISESIFADFNLPFMGDEVREHEELALHEHVSHVSKPGSNSDVRAWLETTRAADQNTTLANPMFRSSGSTYSQNATSTSPSLSMPSLTSTWSPMLRSTGGSYRRRHHISPKDVVAMPPQIEVGEIHPAFRTTPSPRHIAETMVQQPQHSRSATVESIDSQPDKRMSSVLGHILRYYMSSPA